MKSEYGTASESVSQDAIDLVLQRSEKALEIISKLKVYHFSKITNPAPGHTYAGLFAQVTPDDKLHRIEIGGKFWNGDPYQQASTLLHEVSHFDSKGLKGTNDKGNALPGVRFSRDARHSFNSAYRFEGFVMSN